MDILKEVGSEKVDQIIEACLKKGHTIGFAESCTAGLLSAAFGQKPGVSKVLRGSVVSYHFDTKVKILGVQRNTIQSFGEVSLETAKEMAHGARKTLGCDWAVSVTGIAGPSGGTELKPVGTVCFAVVGPDFEEVKREQFSQKIRTEIQLESVKFAIQFLWGSIHA